MSTTYIDLDGVIANWTKGLCTAAGIKYPKNKKIRSFWLDDVLTQDQVDAYHSSTEFWVNLEKMEAADDIVQLVDTYTQDWRFLTKACKSPLSFSGKAIWIQKHYPQHYRRLVVCQDKKSFACKPGDILIDDHPDNISDWLKHDGKPFRWQEITDGYDYTEQLNKLKAFLSINKKIMKLKITRTANTYTVSGSKSVTGEPVVVDHPNVELGSTYEGEIDALPVVGDCMYFYYTKENGHDVRGWHNRLRTTPIIEIKGNDYITKNSVYTIEVLDEN